LPGLAWRGFAWLGEVKPEGRVLHRFGRVFEKFALTCVQAILPIVEVEFG
jgi:hypothetical protein